MIAIELLHVLIRTLIPVLVRVLILAIVSGLLHMPIYALMNELLAMRRRTLTPTAPLQQRQRN